MEQKNNAKVYKNHLEIYDAEQLVEYIKKMVEKNKEIDLSIESKDDKTIIGYMNDVYFHINYVYGRRCSLDIEDGYPTVQNLMLKILNPVMWVVDKKSRATIDFKAPILSYVTNFGMRVFEWDNFDPIQKLKACAFEYYSGVPIKDFKIYYPGVTLEGFKEDLRYGLFKGFFPQNMLYEVDNYEEFELYYNILNLTNLYEKYYEAGQLLNLDVSEKLNSVDYMLCYLLHQTQKFGIKSRRPSVKPFKPTAEQIAWVEWWTDGLKKEQEKNPNLKKLWKKFPKGFDPNFRPKGSYTEFLNNEKTRKHKKENVYETKLIEEIVEDGAFLDEYGLVEL